MNLVANIPGMRRIKRIHFIGIGGVFQYSFEWLLVFNWEICFLFEIATDVVSSSGFPSVIPLVLNHYIILS